MIPKLLYLLRKGQKCVFRLLTRVKKEENTTCSRRLTSGLS